MFYTFMQNNSGGYYFQDENVEQVVIIESDNAENASEKLWEIVEGDYLSACMCCGDRWEVFGGNDGEFETPMIHGRPASETNYGHIIYYAGGRKERFERQ